MGRSIVIGVAPTGGWGIGENNPTSPDQIARAVEECARAGAALVHLHGRDSAGDITADRRDFDTTIELIDRSCDLVVEASTGGVSALSAEERLLPAQNPRAELASLNLGSLNFGDVVYQNSVPHVRYWADKMGKLGVVPSIEVFDTGHLETALVLIDEGVLQRPHNFSLIFGVRWGMKFDPELLEFLLRRLPSKAIWGAVFVGSDSFENHRLACLAGASFVRTGFEDTSTYERGKATSNRELVAALVEAVESTGNRAATTAEARSLLLR